MEDASAATATRNRKKMSTVDRIALTAMLSVAVVIPLLCGMAFGRRC
jgi:hypothetical protein